MQTVFTQVVMFDYIALYGSCIHVGMCTTITIMILTMYTVFTHLLLETILFQTITTHMYSSAGRLALIGQITCIDHQLKLCVIQFMLLLQSVLMVLLYQ